MRTYNCVHTISRFIKENCINRIRLNLYYSNKSLQIEENLLFDPNVLFSTMAFNNERKLFNTFNRQTLVEVCSLI